MKKFAIEVCCPLCGHVSVVKVNAPDYIDWQNGNLAQSCFSYLTPSEREILISGLCSECQDDVFGSDENEDEDYEPADIDDDCGFDPYMGCFTDDC